MARAIDANELEMFPYSEGAGTEEQIADWIEQAGLSEDDTASRARDLCWKVIEGFVNVVKTQPTLTPPNDPLTLEQLRKMDRFSPPIYDICLNEWCCVREDACAGDIGVSYIGGGTRPLEENRFYPYPLPHINRETWTAEWKDHYRSGASAGTGFVCSSCDMWNGRKSHICPSCGKAMTEEAWEELEKRLRR